MGAMAPAQALLASGLISGTGSLSSGLLSSSSAARNNRTALDFQKWSQLQAQEYQTQMYNQQKMDQENFYKKYQSPAAIASQLAQLGVNPAQVFSGGSGVGAAPAATPSGISSPALSAPSLENEGTAFAQSIQAFGNAMSAIAQSGATNEQSSEAMHTFSERVNSLMLQNNQTKLLNAKAEWDLYCSQQKLPYEIQELALNAYSDYYSGEYNKALSKLTDIQAYIEDHSKEFTIEQRNQLSLLAGKQVLLASEDIKLRQEQQETERTQQKLNRSGVVANYASAESSRAQARAFVATADDQEMSNSIRKFALSNEKLATLKKWQKEEKINMSEREQAIKMFNRYQELNQNDKNAAAKYLNYMLWWFKEECPDIPMMLMKF